MECLERGFLWLLRVVPARRERGKSKRRSTETKEPKCNSRESASASSHTRFSLFKRNAAFKASPVAVRFLPSFQRWAFASPAPPVEPSVPPKVPRPIRAAPSALRLGLLCLQRVASQSFGKRGAHSNAADGSPKSRRWESQEPPLGRARHNANAAAPIEPSGARVAEGEALAPKGHASGRANAQVGINGDSSRTVAFGEMRRSEAEGRLPKATAKPPARARGRGVLQGDCEPRKSASLSLPFRFHFTAAAQPPLHRLSSHLATEENGTTLSPRRSQPNRAAQPKQP